MAFLADVARDNGADSRLTRLFFSMASRQLKHLSPAIDDLWMAEI